MKRTNLFMVVLLSVSLVFSGCEALNKTAQGALIGTGTGAAVGAGIGGLIGKDGKSAGVGAAVGTAVGATVGAIIGKKMDKAAEEAAKIEGAQVEGVEDINGLKAVRVTFDSGILFDFNKSTLKADAKEALKDFAKVLGDNYDMDIAVFGHTDNVGTLAANQKVSLDRANVVSKFLLANGAQAEQIKNVEGLDFSNPVASNDTPEGRALNRRVEVFMYASEKMIENAEKEVENN